jgi:two-component system, NarL family, invasion response regulator UvrY
MTAPVTVMLVDDHAVVRAGYRLLLGQTAHVTVIAEAATGEEACQKFAECCPDVVVMDLNLPGIGGLAATRRIISRDPEARILVFSIHDEPVYVARALDAGALGYISKSGAPEMLVSAVVRVAAGQAFLEPALAIKLASQQPSLAATPLDLLTPREFDVLCLLAKGRSTRETAEELRLSAKTVANYVTVIKEKLNVNTTGELIRLAYQTGLVSG